MIQQPFDVVLDEDVRDGSLAAERKAVIVTSVDYLDPKVSRNLEEFIADGGLVLDEQRYEARLDEHALDLTPVEFRLLKTLASRPGRIFPRAELLDSL